MSEGTDRITEVNYCPLTGDRNSYPKRANPIFGKPTSCPKCMEVRESNQIGWVASPTEALGWMCHVCWKRLQKKKLGRKHAFGFYTLPPAGGMPVKAQHFPRKGKAGK